MGLLLRALAADATAAAAMRDAGLPQALGIVLPLFPDDGTRFHTKQCCFETTLIDLYPRGAAEWVEHATGTMAVLGSHGSDMEEAVSDPIVVRA